MSVHVHSTSYIKPARARASTLTSENVGKRKRVNKRWSKHSHAREILEETGREWEREAARGESGVGRDNGDEQVKKVVLFHQRATEILQKQ